MYFQRNWHLEMSSRLAQNSQKDIDCCFVHRLLTRSRRHYLPIAIALLEPNISKNNQMNEKIMQKWQLSKTQCDKHTTGLLELQIRQNVWIKKKSYRRTHREIWRAKEAFDARKTDPSPFKLEDDPLVITNEHPHNVSVKQSIALEPQITLKSTLIVQWLLWQKCVAALRISNYHQSFRTTLGLTFCDLFLLYVILKISLNMNINSIVFYQMKISYTCI